MGRSRCRSKVKKRTVAIVQARMGSVRFPGKMLAVLGGHPLLEWVLHRVTRAAKIDEPSLRPRRIHVTTLWPNLRRIVVDVETVGQLQEILAVSMTDFPSPPLELNSGDIDLINSSRWN